MFRDPPFYHLPASVKILALILVMVLTFLLVLAIGVALAIPLFGRNVLDEITVVANYTDPHTIAALKYFQIVNQIGVFIAPAIIFVMLADDDFMSYLRLKAGMKRFSTFFGFIVILVSLPFINWLLEMNGNIHLPAFLSRVEEWMRESEDKAEQLTNAFLVTNNLQGFLVNLLMIAVLAAVGEELIFRGILVRLFHEWTRSVHLAVIIPALLFSALHLQFYGFFGRFALGLVLGYLFIWSGSLWVPILVHFLNNAMAVVLSFLDQRGIINTDLQTVGASDNTFVILGSFVMMIFTMSMIYLHEKGFFKRKNPVS